MPTRMLLTLIVAITMASPVAARAELSCSLLPLSVVQPRIDAFLLRPETTLETYPRGDTDTSAKNMQISVRQLVAADIGHTLVPLLKLIPRANGFQKQAIGAGFGDAARQCNSAARPAEAQRLVEAIKRSNSPTALTAFMASYIDPQAPMNLEPTEYKQQTNPLGNANVALPSADVFRDHTIRSPFKLYDPFAPMK